MNNFFDILCKDDEEELSDYLLTKGKSPKSVCPIMFIKSEDQNKISNIEEDMYNEV